MDLVASGGVGCISHDSPSPHDIMLLRSLVPIVLSLLSVAVIPARLEAQRPLVLVVHGRGHTARDTATLRRDVLHALRAGAQGITGDSLLRDDDVRLVFYADVLSSRAASVDGAASAACDLSLSGRQETGSIFSLLAMVAGAIVDAGTADDSTTDTDEFKSITGDLRYLGDQRMRCAAERRLGAALAVARAERRPVVLVAHSLGALVSWGHLQARTAPIGDALPGVERLVTLGSPLGSPDIRRLIFGEDTAAITLPTAVKSWVNIMNPDDPFAIRLGLEGADGPSGIVDALTHSGAADPHELRSYLADETAVRAVLGAWCTAFERGSEKACAAIR